MPEPPFQRLQLLYVCGLLVLPQEPRVREAAYGLLPQMWGLRVLTSGLCDPASLFVCLLDFGVLLSSSVSPTPPGSPGPWWAFVS